MNGLLSYTFSVATTMSDTLAQCKWFPISSEPPFSDYLQKLTIKQEPNFSKKQQM